ncbi:MAG: hypothetical protein O7A98_06640 [Acidobacteria bacterium]|nr:hypothetical protein [Acidobacteriota bacterium]
MTPQVSAIIIGALARATARIGVADPERRDVHGGAPANRRCEAPGGDAKRLEWL